MAKQNPNLLLVEGKDEQFALPFFMDEYVVWGDEKKDWVVEIKELDGIEKLLKPGLIEAESKTPGLKAFGVILDANDAFDSRWSRVRERCRMVDSGFPNDLPTDGVIHVRPDGLRIGVWVMPDNRSRGMLETFLSLLLIPERLPLWDFARECCHSASGFAGCYTASHRDKAQVHTYLAWVEPPGLSLPYSILKRAFDARLPLARSFRAGSWTSTRFLHARPHFPNISGESSILRMGLSARSNLQQMHLGAKLSGKCGLHKRRGNGVWISGVTFWNSVARCSRIDCHCSAVGCEW